MKNGHDGLLRWIESFYINSGRCSLMYNNNVKGSEYKKIGYLGKVIETCNIIKY